MSFLNSILDLGKTAVGYLGGNSLGSQLARTAILTYTVNQLSSNALKSNNSGTQNIDQGVRLQVKPDASQKIPVLYGSAFFGGKITDAAMTNSNKTMWYCLVLGERTGNLYSTNAASNYTFNNIYWNDQRIVFNSDGITANYTVDRSGTIDRSISGLVKVYLYAGGRTQGKLPSGYTGTVPNAETLFPNWTTGTHNMSNLVFALVRVDYNRDKNVTGLGNMLFHVTNSMTLPGDVLYDYLINTTYGAGITANEIDTADITALNTYSSNSVSYNDQGLGAQNLANRYQINGLIDTGNPVLENAEAILSSAASWLSYDTQNGLWGVVINRPAVNQAELSTYEFNDSNIIGSVSVSGTGLQDLYNEVKVEFPHRQLRDSADFYKITIPTGDRNANEEDNTLNISYDIINEPIQAQLLGLIELKQSRLDKVVRFKCDFDSWGCKAGDFFILTNSRLGFVNKPFRMVSVTELQEDDSLSLEIIGLEYDANVYSTTDLYRFTRSDVNGIITIGSIGIPGTPVVTKTEVDSRPRISVSSLAPTGVVEGMEFWITFDVGISDDLQRNYKLIGSVKPTNTAVFTSGQAVIFEYDQLDTSNFYIKTRGFNTTTVGGYSDPSGLIEFAPQQTTDAIGPNTQAFDSTGGLLGALALIELLTKLSDLYPTVTTAGTIFDRIFDLFKDTTGVDLVGEASGGTLVVASNIIASKDGTEVEANLSELNFKGNNLTVVDNEGVTDITYVNVDETWNTVLAESVTENYTVDGVVVQRFKTITFQRPDGKKVTANISWP